MMMVRMMMVRLIARATRHHELRATCFPRGGVPTGMTEWLWCRERESMQVRNGKGDTHGQRMGMRNGYGYA